MYYLIVLLGGEYTGNRQFFRDKFCINQNIRWEGQFDNASMNEDDDK